MPPRSQCLTGTVYNIWYTILYIYICTYVHMYICTYVHMYICTYIICIYIYIYIYIWSYVYRQETFAEETFLSAGSMWTQRPVALDGCPTPDTRCQLIPHQHQAPPLPRQLRPLEAKNDMALVSGVLVFATRQAWSTTKNQMYEAKLLILWLVYLCLYEAVPALRCLAKTLRISTWENLYAVRSLHMNLGWPNLAFLFRVQQKAASLISLHL